MLQLSLTFRFMLSSSSSWLLVVFCIALFSSLVKIYDSEEVMKSTRGLAQLLKLLMLKLYSYVGDLIVRVRKMILRERKLSENFGQWFLIGNECERFSCWWWWMNPNSIRIMRLYKLLGTWGLVKILLRFSYVEEFWNSVENLFLMEIMVVRSWWEIGN